MAETPQVVVALLTPFGDDGRLDAGALAMHVDFLVEAGVDGLMPCGTTGEGALLEPDEIASVVTATVRAAAGRVPVLAHVGRPATGSTVRLALRAVEAGASAVSAVTPYFYAPTADGLLGHYRQLVAEVAGVPVYAYVIPGRTGTDLTPDAVRALHDEGLTGVKDSTKSWQRHLEYLASGAQVLVGTDAFVAESFRSGSAGCVSALANVRPDLLCAVRDGGEVQDEISALRDELPFGRLKDAVAERLPGYPSRYLAPLP